MSTAMLPDTEIDLKTVGLMLKRRKSIIINSVAVAVLLALVFIFSQQPRYTSEAVLQFRLQNNNVVDIESVVSGLTADNAALESEIDVIRSRELLSRVAAQLNLEDTAEFRPNISNSSMIKKLWGFFGAEDTSEADADAIERLKQRRENAIVQQLRKYLHVSRPAKSYTVTVSYTSQSPDMAAKIANTIVDEYLIDQLNTRFEATKRANEWLNERVQVLRENARASERAVQQFKQEHDLLTVGESENSKQLAELNSQIIIARTQRAQAEVRLQQVRSMVEQGKDLDAVADVLNSELINKLLFEESEVLRKESELRERYKDRHPVMIKIRAELKNLRDSIRREVNKITKAIDYEVNTAKLKEQSLESDLTRLRKTLGTSNKHEMQLQELVREMETNQALYEAFLTRFKETSEDQNFYQSDARIISRAQVPEAASWPRKKLVLAMALVLGLMVGVTIILLIEYFDNAFRNLGQVETTLGVSATGMIPEIAEDASPVDYCVNKINSAYSEALRSVATAVHFSNPDNPPKSIVITSSVPQEGKSVFAASLARLMAKSGRKVLLVDCDLRLPTVHKTFKSDANQGLGDYLTGQARLEDIITVDKASGLSYIRAFRDTPHSQELLGSNMMQRFLDMAETSYDLVILDTPPIMALADSIVLSHMADAVLLLARWEHTPRHVVKESVKRLASEEINLAGVVLSRVDIAKQARYDYGYAGYYYGKYKDYYTE